MDSRRPSPMGERSRQFDSARRPSVESGTLVSLVPAGFARVGRYHVVMSTFKAWLERRKWHHRIDEPDRLTSPASDSEHTGAQKVSAYLPRSGSAR